MAERSPTPSGSNREEKEIVVVGAGWAGLAAAVELTRRGYPVTLLEAAAQAGGRARSIAFGERRVDNGQHLLIGAYHETLRLMARVGSIPAQVLARRPLRLLMAGAEERLDLRAAPLPAPLHLAWGLLRGSGLGAQQRLQAIRFCNRLYLSGFRLAEDRSVSQLLAEQQQPLSLVRALWEPLCLAALNTPMEQASAKVFLRVLRDTFALRRRDSDLILAQTDLGHVLPQPALEFLQARGCRVELSRPVRQLLSEHGRVCGVGADDRHYPAQHVVLAIPPRAARRLTGDHPALNGLNSTLDAFNYQPITTVYLQYPPGTRLQPPMQGLVGATAQWIFDRKCCGQGGLMAVVISGPGAHMELDRESLAQRVIAELAARFPQWPVPTAHLVVREKQATFSCEVGIDYRRPDNATALAGLWLAGDHTATGYPATLEGAVRSGIQCAHRIMGESRYNLGM